MPTVTPADLVGLHLSTLNKADLAAVPVNAGRYPFPMDQLLRQIVSNRIILAGEHLQAGDRLILATYFRSAISRHYYAMYHAARAIVFADHKGDDYERHHILPRNLPSSLPDLTARETELMNARLLRNQADYDCYPIEQAGWEDDSRALAPVAATFVGACQDYALSNGYI